MSTRFGTCVSNSANSIVMETLLEIYDHNDEYDVSFLKTIRTYFNTC